MVESVLAICNLLSYFALYALKQTVKMKKQVIFSAFFLRQRNIIESTAFGNMLNQKIIAPYFRSFGNQFQIKR